MYLAESRPGKLVRLSATTLGRMRLAKNAAHRIARNQQFLVRRNDELSRDRDLVDACPIPHLFQPATNADTVSPASPGHRVAHKRRRPEDKAQQEEAFGLSRAEIDGMTGKTILKTRRFKNKCRELPESTIEKVAVEKDSVTVHFLEPDGDHEKMVFVRRDGKWKVWLTIPKLTPS